MYNLAVAVVYETEQPLAPRSTLGPYLEADYLALPDEPRCELLYGRLQVTPAPTFRHQEVAMALGRLLFENAQREGARTVAAPVDVVLAPHSIVQPDLVYVCRERLQIIGSRVEGAPDLVIEIISPSTSRRDLGEKLRLYVESGVAEYWIFDPATKTSEFLVHRDGAFVVRLPVAGMYRSEAIAGLELDLETFWRQLPD